MSVAAALARASALEYLEYDSAVARSVTAIGGVAACRLLWALGDRTRALAIASRVHRSGASDRATRIIEGDLRHRRADLLPVYDAHIRQSIFLSNASAFRGDPSSLLGYRALVMKSARGSERGVLVLDYSYIFPIFAALYDIDAVARRYQIVLEPSWRGICTADVLSYTTFDFPVLVESIEPRDIAFIDALRGNLSTIPISANWWIDHRLVKPIPNQTKDIDVVMIASWSALKRHWRLFRTLAALRRRGRRLRTALVGYAGDMTRADIEAEAKYFGVADQIQLFEKLPLDEVGRLLARSKVHLLWSRKEGANRAIIEAMLADVPVVVRRGLSYGYAYPYINRHTGCFADEHELGDVLLETIESREQFRPREWVMTHMTCQRATAELEDAVRRIGQARGEPWTTGLTVKVSRLDTQAYWDPSDAEQFADDYAFLRSAIRLSPRPRG